MSVCVWAQCRGALHRARGGGRGAGAAAGPLGARSTVCHLRSSRHTWKSHGHVKWKHGSSAPNNNSPSPTRLFPTLASTPSMLPCHWHWLSARQCVVSVRCMLHGYVHRHTHIHTQTQTHTGTQPSTHKYRQ